MFIIDSIRIRNFRAVANATFQPGTGITGIFGQNGSGKTTFLTAVLFALYGVRPPDTALAAIRRDGSTGECSVSVLLTHMGQKVEVIRELKGKSNRIIVNIFVDGVPQTITSVGAADQWVQQRLGIDSTGFMTAFVVRQKELDALITARPAERKQIIEKLAGIDTIKAALQSAREDENAAKKVLLTFPGSESAVEEAENQLNLHSQKLEDLSAIYNQAYNAYQDLVRSNREQNSEYNSLRDKELASLKAINRLETLGKDQQRIKEQLEGLSYVTEMSEGRDVLSLRAEHASLTKAISEKNTFIAEARNRQQRKIETIKTASNSSDIAASQLENTILPSKTRQELESQFSQAEKNRQQAIDKHTLIISRREDLENSIGVLQHSTECPTCHTELSNPQKLIESFKITLSEYNSELLELDKIKKENEELLSYTAENLATLDKIDKLKQVIAENNLIIETAQLDDESDSVELLTEEVNTLESEKSSVLELGIKAANLQKDKEKFVELTEALLLLENEEERINNWRTTDGAYDAKRAEKLRGSIAQLQNKIDLESPKVEQLAHEKSSTDSKLTMAKSAYKIASDQWKRKKDLLGQQSRLALTTDMLEKFRTDSISQLAPELSEYATSLISDMTNGDFVEVQLDDEFNASIVDRAGIVRPVSWLSGGEVSAVALALRIAIGFLITGGNPELLWLDEVLTAQDADRRMAMLAMIRSLPINQVIMINHTDDAQQIVDKSVTLIKDLENGSYISEES